MIVFQLSGVTTKYHKERKEFDARTIQEVGKCIWKVETVKRDCRGALTGSIVQSLVVHSSQKPVKSFYWHSKSAFWFLSLCLTKIPIWVWGICTFWRRFLISNVHYSFTTFPSFFHLHTLLCPRIFCIDSDLLNWFQFLDFTSVWYSTYASKLPIQNWMLLIFWHCTGFNELFHIADI